MRTPSIPRGSSERLWKRPPTTTTRHYLSLHTIVFLSLLTVAILEGILLGSLMVSSSITHHGGGIGGPLALLLHGAEAAYDPAISIPYTDEFELLDPDPTHFGSFRLVSNYSSSGVMRGLRMRLNWTVVAGTSGAMVKLYSSSDASRTIVQDVFGNLYQLRSSQTGWPLVANITKGLPKMRFGIGNNGEAVEAKASMSEFSEWISYGVAMDDPRCSTSSFLCCQVYTNSYWRHTIINSGSSLTSDCTRSLLSYEPGDVNPIDYRYSLGMTTTVLGTTTSISQPIVSHSASLPIRTFTDAASTLTTTMKSTELAQIQSRPSRSSVCNRGPVYTPGKTVWDFNEPFMVPYTAFGSGLKKIGIEPGVFKATRTCTYLPEGEAVAVDRNNSDQFWNWDNQQWFGYPLGTTNNFVCDWGNDFTAATPTTPPIIGLTCNQPSITQNIVAEFNVLTQMFRPLHAIISHQHGTAVWDQRTKKIRISLRLWSAGEYSANVTATIKYCTLEYDSIDPLDPITNTSLTDAPNTTTTSSLTSPTIRSKRSHTRYINASYAERVHLFLSSIHLPIDTPIGRQIGACYVEVDVLNVKSSLSVFPQLANIKVPLTSIATNISLLHRNKFRIDNPQTWREIFKKPVSGGYANIVPAQYSRRREHLRSRYRTNTLAQALLGAVTRQQRMDAAYDKVSATDPFPNPSTPPLHNIYANTTSTSSASYQQRSFSGLASSVTPLTALPPGQSDPQSATISRYKIYRFHKRDITSSLVDKTFPQLDYNEKMVDLIPDEPATYISDTNPLFKEDGTARYDGTGITFPIPVTTRPSDSNNTPGPGNQGVSVVSASDVVSSSLDAIFLATGALLLVVACLMMIISGVYYCSKSHRRALIDGWLIFYPDFSKPTKRLLRERLGADFFGSGELDSNNGSRPQSHKDGCNSGAGSQKGVKIDVKDEGYGLPSDVDLSDVVSHDGAQGDVAVVPHYANMFETAQLLDYKPPVPLSPGNQHRPHSHYDPMADDYAAPDNNGYFEEPPQHRHRSSGPKKRRSSKH